MVDQLSSFASEVTRVAREVGTEGKLGGQADVRGVAGTWKDLTDSVNPSFSTRGVGGPGNRSRTTSWSKGLHYKSYARLFSSNFPAHPVCMALRMADEVTTNDCSHKSRAGK